MPAQLCVGIEGSFSLSTSHVVRLFFFVTGEDDFSYILLPY